MESPLAEVLSVAVLARERWLHKKTVERYTSSARSRSWL
jgi:hypothetical protein